jgi:hypothetical protein
MFRFDWSRWLQKTFGTPTRRHRRRETRPRVEPLEPRWVPSFVVKGIGGFIDPGVTEGPLTGEPVALYAIDTPSDTVTAAIDWGDGTTSAGTVSPNPNGSGEVFGDHTYYDEGIYHPVVTLTEQGSSPDTDTIANGSITVNEGDSLTGSGASFAAREGEVVSGSVATFTDTNSSALAGFFTATIDWGDGTTSAGAVGGGLSNPLIVLGSHTYAEEGTFNPVVTLTDVNDSGRATATATATGTATVAEADSLSGTGRSDTLTEGISFSSTVAKFTDTNTSAVAGDFTASIDWGDGTTDTGAAVTVTGGNGSFTVRGTHAYADEGNFTATATLTDDAPGTATASASSSVTVAEADVLSGTGATFGATEGTPFSGSVATFTDTNPAADPADLTASIAWGDGATTPGTVSGGAGSPFTVSGAHTYADEGPFTTTVTLSDDAPGTATATATGTATVAEADALFVAGLSTGATEGKAFSGAVATLVDNGYPGASPSDFTATITWGDGTTSAGTVEQASFAGFEVSGSHTYLDEGSFAVKVTVTDDGPGTATATATGTATVADADSFFSLTTVPLQNVTEGKAFSGSVALFSTTGYDNNTAADFTATIKWGDGTTSAGTVTGSGGSYTVSGSHTYVDEGLRSLSVTVADDAPGTATATATGTATVAEADSLTGQKVSSLSVTEGQKISEVVGLFGDTNKANVAGDFKATINWGDGTTSAGTVGGGSGGFTVNGSHTYADEGTFTITTTLADDAPGTATSTVTANVGEADSLDGSGVPITAAAGTDFIGPVAVFTSTYSGNVGSGFTASIDWGDGTTTAGEVVGAGGVYTVNGDHTYANSGTFAVSVQVSDNGQGTAFANPRTTATVTSSSPPPTSTGGPPSSSSSSSPSQMQVGEVALDAWLVVEGLLTNNASLEELGLGGYLFAIFGLPSSVQSQMQTDFFRDIIADLALSSFTSSLPSLP